MPRVLLVSAQRDDDPASPPAAAAAPAGGPGLEVTAAFVLRVVDRHERLAGPLADLPAYRWIALTSARGAQALGRALRAAGIDAAALAEPRLACLAGATREAALAERLRPALVAEGGGQALAEALLAAGVGAGPVLFPRAAEGRDELPAALRAAGARVEVVAAYETVVDGEVVRQVVAGAAEHPFDAVAFASPRGVQALVEGGLRLSGLRLGAIGRTTARALEERGLTVEVVASSPSFEVLLAELGQALARPAGIR